MNDNGRKQRIPREMRELIEESAEIADRVRGDVMDFLEQRYGEVTEGMQEPDGRVEDYCQMMFQIALATLTRTMVLYPPERRKEEIAKFAGVTEAVTSLMDEASAVDSSRLN